MFIGDFDDGFHDREEKLVDFSFGGGFRADFGEVDLVENEDFVKSESSADGSDETFDEPSQNQSNDEFKILPKDRQIKLGKYQFPCSNRC